MSFFDLGVNPAIVKTLSKSGINDPFPIQKATLPDAISGKDVLGRGQTGSGKSYTIEGQDQIEKGILQHCLSDIF